MTETEYHIEYSPKSVQAIRQIAQYLAQRSDVAPFTVISMSKVKIDNLKVMPRIGKIVDKRPRLRRLVADRYMVFYEIVEEKKLIRISNVVHSSRQRKIDRFLAETRTQTENGQ